MEEVVRLTTYEKRIRREVEQWQRGGSSMLALAFTVVMKPVDWVIEQAVPAEIVDQAGSAVEEFLAVLSDASKWTTDTDKILAAAKGRGIDADRIEDLRDRPLEELDDLARSFFGENTILATLSGGGTGLGGAVLIAADIPLLFMINLRLIQQISAAYGFPMIGPEYRPVVLSIYNAAAANEPAARGAAMREIGVAAASFAGDAAYRGKVRGTIPDQSRHVPREVAKNIVGRKLLQTIPLAGMAVGAGINYWFTREAANTTFMLLRGLFVEYKERL